MSDLVPIRRRNAATTKARILLAAKAAFSEGSYPTTGIRDIARRAEVAPSLVVQHFGSKAELFEAAMVSAMNDQRAAIGDRATFGQRIADWLGTGSDLKLPAMIVLSVGDEDARAIAARLIRGKVLGRLADWLGPPDPLARATAIMMTLTGFIVYARQLPMGAIETATLSRLAKSLQAIVDETDG